MSNISFMENMVNRIEKLFNYYFKNKKIYPTALEKEDYRNFLLQMEKIHRYGEMEDELTYKRLLKKARQCDITKVVEMRKAVKNAK